MFISGSVEYSITLYLPGNNVVTALDHHVKLVPCPPIHHSCFNTCSDFFLLLSKGTVKED
jgi:hypothetical protein